MTASQVLCVIAVLAPWVGWLYLASFGRCPKCQGTGHIHRGRRVKVCPRCKGRRRVQRLGSRTVHWIAYRIRDGQRAAARYQEDSRGDSYGAHTHGSGSGLGGLLVILLAGALLGPPAAAAAAELLHVLAIVAGVIVGVGAVGVGGLLAWRWRRPRRDAARAMPPLPQKMARAASPLPQARRPPALPSASARELPGSLHLHFHGVSLEEIAAIIERRRPEEP
jgi:hypothetical protein